MLTLNANLTAAWGKSTKKLAGQVSITPVGAGGTVFHAFDQEIEDTAHDANPQGSVVSVSSVSSRIDPWSRRLEVGQITVKFAHDAWFQNIMATYRLKGQKIVLNVGDSSVTVSQWAPYFSGVIDEVRPQVDGSVDVLASDVLGILRDNEITGWWYSKHPLEII